MLVIRWDVAGRLELRWPDNDAEVVAAGTMYVAHEEGLPPEQRLTAPALELVKSALGDASDALDKADTGEIERAGAAGELASALLEAADPIDQAILNLKGRYFKNLAKLEAWGLETVSTQRGVSVRKPDSDPGLIAFLRRYVEQETSLPESERLAEPSLEAMTGLNARIQAAIAARDQGRLDRQSGVATRSVASEQLRMLLQIAAVVLTGTRFGGMVSRELEPWGYRVVERAAGSAAQASTGNGAAAPAEDASSPAIDPATNAPAG